MATEADKQRKQKQQYLIDAIQNENYNTALFATFLQSKKPDGANIEVWTMKELQDVSLSVTHVLSAGL
jgi:hypothetical protein